MFLTPFDLEPFTKRDLLYTILYIFMLFSVVGMIAFVASLSKPPVFKMITPYGNSYYEGEENRPYLQYQATFMKGDTEVFVVGGKAYKIIQLKR